MTKQSEKFIKAQHAFWNTEICLPPLLSQKQFLAMALTTVFGKVN